VYTPACLAPARAALERGERRMVGFHDAVCVATLREDELDPVLRAGAPATNVNTPEDLARERHAEVPS